MQEIWKDVVGYEGRYKVSNLGNVMSMRYRGHEGARLMRQTAHHGGYKVVGIGKETKSRFVHVLVAKAFVDNPDGKPFVNHIDGDKHNNRADNLEWVTALENIRHAIKTGLRDPHSTPRRYGADNHTSKPVLQYDLQGNFIARWGGQSEAARFMGCRSCEISAAVDRKNRTCCGFMWVSCDKDAPESSIVRKIQPFQNRLTQHKILQFTVSGEFVREWSGAQEITASGLFVARSAVDCCKGRQKTAYGYVWKYAE